MSRDSQPPKAYRRFVERFPQLGQAWDLIREEGRDGPLDARTIHLVKLGLAMGAMREGALHSAVRKAMAIGIDRAEIEQVVALSAGVLGLPATVAAHCWARDILDGDDSD
ncbi:MAG: carboxymuconolactone decarboxylase family protein [Planctomycetes bacterium]|nr:carboxymuconolactone decarboxylase family protein [Planctomycetota bacterium]